VTRGQLTKRVLALLALSAAVPATATPTYLSCAIPHTAGPDVINITSDEDNQLVSINLPKTGYFEKLSAVFLPGKVSAKGRGGTIYEISRTDLSFTRGNVGSKMVERGRCEVREPPERAF
jgi:hypothetical protein